MLEQNSDTHLTGMFSDDNTQLCFKMSSVLGAQSTLPATKVAGHTSGVPRNFVRGGVQQIQLGTEGRENGDLGAVAP
jgi:hypothetical protein